MSFGSQLPDTDRGFPIPPLACALALAMVCTIGVRGPEAAGPAAPIDARRDSTLHFADPVHRSGTVTRQATSWKALAATRGLLPVRCGAAYTQASGLIDAEPDTATGAGPEAAATLGIEFETAPTFIGPACATAIVVADLNGDGHPDVAMSGLVANGFSIYPGPYAAGGFGARIDVPVYGRPSALAFMDVDRDGDLDALVGHYESGDSATSRISVLSNLGGFSFGARADYGCSPLVTSIVAADQDGDGWADLSTTSWSGGERGNTSWLRNRGDGTFAPAVFGRVGGGTGGGAACDVTGDGRPDLVTADTYCGSLSLVPAGLDGAPTPARLVPAERGAIAVAPSGASFGGRPELVAATNDASRLSIFHARPDGFYTYVTASPTGRSPNAMAVADLDADGAADVLTANYGSSGVTPLHREAGTYSPGLDAGAGPNTSAVATGDLDEDGTVDLVAANYGNGTFTFLRGRGGMRYAGRTDCTRIPTPAAATLADVDGDGRAEVISAGYMSDVVTVSRRTGADALGDAVSWPVGSMPRAVTAGDLNGDGRVDLATANQYGNSVSVLLNLGDGTFAPQTEYPVGSEPFDVAIGDLDGDGHPDLVTADYTSDWCLMLTNQGDGSFVWRGHFPAGNGPTSVKIGDFDHDGRTDVAVASYEENTVYVAWQLNPGAFTPTVVGHCQGPWSLEVTDLNYDGWSDLLVTARRENRIQLLTNARGRSYLASYLAVGESPSSIAIGDLDADGDADLAVSNYGGSDVQVFANIGVALFSPAGSYAVGAYPSCALIAPFDDDALPELCIASEGTPLSVFRNISRAASAQHPGARP